MLPRPQEHETTTSGKPAAPLRLLTLLHHVGSSGESSPPLFASLSWHVAPAGGSRPPWAAESKKPNQHCTALSFTRRLRGFLNTSVCSPTLERWPNKLNSCATRSRRSSTQEGHDPAVSYIIVEVDWADPAETCVIPRGQLRTNNVSSTSAERFSSSAQCLATEFFLRRRFLVAESEAKLGARSP